MILESQTETIIQQEGISQDTIEMSLDMDSAQILMQILSKNLYSDAIGSTIREWASNALDSHRKANISDPIIVFFGKDDQGNYNFSVEDFGVGLDDDDVKNIISKYGKSTKRLSNNELGMFGLGFKVGLAYFSSFYFICRKNGIERKYMMYEGEDVNTIDLLYEKATTERNGVKMIIPVNYYDKGDFLKKIKSQLCYFENIYFDCEGTIDNSFSVYRGEDFQISDITSDRSLHLCLDNVYYPIDFQKLGISAINVPIGLRFSLTDGIFPTPNRESIRYTTEAKEAILKKIENVATFFVEKYNDSIVEITDLKSLFNYYSQYNSIRVTIKDIPNGVLNITDFVKYASISIENPILKNVFLLNPGRIYDIREYILNEYEAKYRIFNGRFSEIKGYYDKQISFRRYDINKCIIYIFTDRISSKMKSYLKQKHSYNNNSHIFFVKKNKPFTLGKRLKTDYDTYYSLLSLEGYSKDKWRTLITEFQGVLNDMVKEFIDLDSFEIPQDWLDAQKKKKVKAVTSSSFSVKKVKLQGEITYKVASSLERYVNGKNCKWVSETYNMENIYKVNKLTVYSNNSIKNVSLMDGLFKIFSIHKSNVRFISFSDRELKNMEKITLHNWIKLKDFMKGENKPFKRLVTAYLINELYDNQRSVFSMSDRLADVSKEFSEKIHLLQNYRDKWYTHASEDVYKAIVEIAINNNLFDMEIYHIYKEVKEMCEKLKFLNPLCGKLGYGPKNDDAILNAIIDLCKYYKQKVNWKNYITLNENEDTLIEESVEELEEQL
jgi:hypothetical protein